MQREVSVFFAIFLRVVRRSQTPKEQLQTLLLTDVQKDVKELKAQLAQVNDLAGLSAQLGPLIAGQLEGKLRALLPMASTDEWGGGVAGGAASGLV